MRFLVLLAVLVSAPALAQTPAQYQRVSLTAVNGSSHGEVLCLSSAATAVSASTMRRAVTVQNRGPNAVTICTSATCAVGSGIILEPRDMLTLEVRPTIPIHCRAAVADQTTGAGLRFIEVR
jgi:hypothetical protein